MIKNSDINEKILENMLTILSKSFTEMTMNLWFNSLVIKEITAERIILYAESEFKKNIIEEKYISFLKEAFTAVLGYEADIILLLQNDDNFDEDDEDEEFEEKSRFDDFVGKDYTFESFVVGSSNQLAHAASLAVAKNPAALYNPLFLYGPSGIGKTHLLYAIYNYVRKNFNNFNILYVTSEEFSNQILEAIGTKTQVAFREKFRKADLLLVDDMQFISKKTTMQEEFFHTFNALFEQKKQIVLTSDRPPNDIEHLEERLRSRFINGLIADIQPPDAELRIIIFKRKAEMFDVDIPMDVLSYLADNIKDNIRQIEGAIKTLKAHSLITGKDITLPMAKNALTDFFKKMEAKGVTTDKIIDYISKRYSVKKDDLFSSKRSADISNVRHIAVYVLRTMTPLSYKSIASLFSKDHSTIMSSFNKVYKRTKSDPAFNREMNEIVKEIKNM